MRAARETIELLKGHSFRVLRWTRSLRDVECFEAPGVFRAVTSEGTHWHYHREMELTIFASGRGTRFVGDHIGEFDSGDLVLLGENLPHYWHTNGPSSGISIQWCFPNNHPFWSFPENLPLALLFKEAAQGLHISGNLARCVSGLMEGLCQQTGICQLGALLNLLGILQTGSGEEMRPMSIRSFALSSARPHQQAIADVVRYLAAHFRGQVRLEELVALSGMSRPTFARQFKKHAGRTVSEFVNELRLQAACSALSQTTQSVLEIAMDSGFSQVSFFNRLFQKMLRCTPSQYRVRCKGAGSRH